MVVVFMVRGREIPVKKTIEEMLNSLRIFGVEPSHDWGGIITFGDKIFLVYRDSVEVEKIAKAFGVDVATVKKVREFKEEGKGRYLIYEEGEEGRDYFKIEVIKE